jgi:hypothetical protein
MKKNLIPLVIVLGLALSACARRVVLAPEAALQKNSADWTVKSEPRKVAQMSEAPKPAEEGAPPPKAKKSAKPKASKRR